MKASELMMGDLVKHRFTGKVIKVATVGSSSVGEVLKDGTHEGHSERNIEAIPLVRVHLVKNGFKVKDEDDSLFVYKDDYCEIRVRFDGGIKEMDLPPVIALQIEGADFDLFKCIESLHELQQAMRFMNIEKQIEL